MGGGGDESRRSGRRITTCYAQYTLTTADRPPADRVASSAIMKSSFVLLLASYVACTFAYSSFSISSMTSHQPIGSGSTNFYFINFEINSTNSGSPSTAYCQVSWGDNGWTRTEPYSINVPTGSWTNCDSSQGAYDGDSAFQFQLYPYFSIGNFTVEVKQDLGKGSRYDNSHHGGGFLGLY